MGPSVAAVVVAAGRGVRAGGSLPKQYRELAGEPVIRSSLALFSWHGQIGAVQAVIPFVTGHTDDLAPAVGASDAFSHGLRRVGPEPAGQCRRDHHHR